MSVKISVVVPYNGEKEYLDDLFAGLEEQTVKDFEVIFILGHAASGAEGEISGKSASFPIKVVKLPADKDGVAAARNMGIRSSSGDYVLFLDSDDYLEKTAIEEFSLGADDKDIIYARRRRTPYARDGYYADRERILAEREARRAEAAAQAEATAQTDDTAGDEDEQDMEGEESFVSSYSEVDYEDWSGVFSKIIVIEPAISGISALGLIYKRSFLEQKEIFFDESFKCFPDLKFVSQAMCATSNVKRLTSFLYIKRKHSDPIKMPSLAQKTDEDIKLREAMEAYLSAKSHDKLKGTYPETRLDGKFIRYYVTKISPYFLKGEEKKKPAVYEKALKCLPLITGEALKHSKRYSRRIV